jgi:CHAD domain
VARQHHDTALACGSPAPVQGPVTAADGSAGDVLATYLQRQATTFLRALALLDGDSGDEAEPGQLMRRAADRIGAALDAYSRLTDPVWAEPLRGELAWLSATLAREHQYAAWLTRLMSALNRLSSDLAAPYSETHRLPDHLSEPVGATVPAPASADGGRQSAVGAARAGALLDRQLTLARSRAHSAALQATGSARFHAVADAVALLASEVPLSGAASAPAVGALAPCADQARARLTEAVGALPLARSVHAYNADALLSSLSADARPETSDTPWNRVRILLRLLRQALEVTGGDGDERLSATAGLLERHYDAAEAAAAAAAAARTPRIAPATAYALGVLHADQRREVEAARFAFARLWH